ncbi:MAG: heme-binding protein, partial [Planctomycetota bacterium]
EILLSLDQRLRNLETVRDVQRRLRTGIVALLATSNEESASEYLRELWRSEPQRRTMIAMALAMHPDGENWDYLVRSLNIVDLEAGIDVVTALKTVDIATDDPMALRHLILLGVKAEEEGRVFEPVEQLLEHWTGMERPEEAKASMKPWQKWYSGVYPDRPAAVLPEADQSKWDFEQLVGYLESNQGKYGDPGRGKIAYAKAQCVQCHRFGNNGESIGPDLSGIARRFTTREIVESLLYPSHVVSDQYASKKILTLDGKVYVGMVSEQTNGTLEIRDAKNNISSVDAEEVDQILPSNTSIMPSGLIDELTLREISDMMAYLGAIPSVEIAKQPNGTQR